MIIWGTGGDSLDLGFVETKRCDTCAQDRGFNLLLGYRYFHFYYLFGMVTEKKYWLVCDVCRRGWALLAKDVESQLLKIPIPAHHRYGCLVGLGLAAFIFVLAMLFGR